MYKYLCGVLVYTPLVTHAGVVGLDHGSSVFSYVRNATLICMVVRLVYISPASCKGFSFPHPYQHLLLLVFFMIAILTGVSCESQCDVSLHVPNG